MCGILEILNSDMLSVEGPESYQPGYATSAHLLCWHSQVGHKPITICSYATRADRATMKWRGLERKGTYEG
jgi:hypothetical protein